MHGILAGLKQARATYILQEEMELGVAVGVLGHLKQGVEDVVQQLLKVLNDALLLVHIVQPWQLQVSHHKWRQNYRMQVNGELPA